MASIASRLASAALLLALAAASALATDAPLSVPVLPAPASTNPPEPGSQADSLTRHPDCRELSNDCAICRRTGAEEASCSTPGIACQPSAWRCVEDNGTAEIPTSSQSSPLPDPDTPPPRQP